MRLGAWIRIRPNTAALRFVPAVMIVFVVFGGQAGKARAAITYPDTHKFIDSCTVPTDQALQDFYNSTPYYDWGMYIGGEEAAAVTCHIWSAAKATTARNDHWALVPIWDGLQAPCSGNAAKMSSNATTAYNQGVTAADNASTAYFARGFQAVGVLFLDMEFFSPADTTCRNAVKSFINGWVEELTSKAIIAGVYGSSCASYANDWLTIAHPAVNAWLADWNGTASAWGVACVANSKWSDDERSPSVPKWPLRDLG